MKLNTKTFETPGELAEFVNDNSIEREDIQSILHTFDRDGVVTSFTIFYWTANRLGDTLD